MCGPGVTVSMWPRTFSQSPQTHLDTLLLGFPLSFPSCLLVSLLSSSEGLS